MHICSVKGRYTYVCTHIYIHIYTLKSGQSKQHHEDHQNHDDKLLLRFLRQSIMFHFNWKIRKQERTVLIQTFKFACLYIHMYARADILITIN